MTSDLIGILRTKRRTSSISGRLKLQNALKTLAGVGPTISTKLIARKRPRLVPTYDSIVAAVTDTAKGQWEPLRMALRDEDRALQKRLLRLRQAAVLSDAVSALRVLDVIAWMEGKKAFL